MVATGKKTAPPAKAGDRPEQTPPPPAEDDDIEDGDFATPKRDRHGDDDQPL